MADVTLVAQNRPEIGKGPAGRVRREGQVPAVVYGLGGETVSVSVGARELNHILAGESGANTLITLEIEGGTQLALVRQIQRHPVKRTLVHVDFVRVRADQTIQAEVPVRLVGDAEGVSRGGVLEQLVHAVRVEARPADVPTVLELDITDVAIGGSVHVGLLAAPAGVLIHNDADEMIAQISAPRVSTETAGEGEGGEGEAAGEGAPSGEE